MQIDKAAHAALRLKFTNNTLGIRATNGQARLLIEEGRKTQPKDYTQARSAQAIIRFPLRRGPIPT